MSAASTAKTANTKCQGTWRIKKYVITIDNNTTAYKFKDMEFYDLDDKELKIAVLRNLMSYKKHKEN